MPKKKKFIDKKQAVTFHLVHRSQRDPLQADTEASQHVLLPLESLNDKTKSETQKEEQKKYGVFFDDDYNYLQHLKDVEEIYTDLEPEAVKVVTFKDESNSSDIELQAPKLQLPTSLFGSELETEVGLLNKAAPIRGPRPDWDPDIVAALDEDFNFDDPENQLDDDFFIKANAHASNSEDHKGILEEGEGADYPSDEADEDMSDVDSFGERAFSEEETKSHFTQYSMTSSVLKRNEGLTLLDDRFEKFYEQYDDDEIGALDHEEIEGGVQENSKVLDSIMKEFEQQMKETKLKDVVDESEETGDNVEIISDSDSDASDTEIVKMVVEEPGEKWDCESILSTYSTLYNHPKIIEAPKKNKGIKLTKRAQIPVDSLPDHGPTRRQMEQDMNAANKRDRAMTYRSKDESTEEKKARKQAIKDERKERRVEKKANTLAFKSEKLRQGKEQINLQSNLQGLKIT